MRYKLVALYIAGATFQCGEGHSAQLTPGDQACIAASAKSIRSAGLNFSRTWVQAVNPSFAAFELVGGVGFEPMMAFARERAFLDPKTAAQIELLQALGMTDIARGGLAATLRQSAVWVAEPMLSSSEPAALATFRSYCIVFRNGETLVSPALTVD